MQGKLLLDKSACQVHTVNVNVLLQKTYSMSYGQLYRDFVFFLFYSLEFDSHGHCKLSLNEEKNGKKFKVEKQGHTSFERVKKT